VLPANGSVVAWQEAVIGPEISNYRITEVRVQVGDQVKKGQVLARIASDTVASELAEARGGGGTAGQRAEAKANAEPGHGAQGKGFLQFATEHPIPDGRAHGAGASGRRQARQQAAGLKWSKTSVLAPDDGVISARSATVGSLTQPGQELFRLIRGGRLEWRAEVPSADLVKVNPARSPR
jgi:HlyD family secretion protein